MEAKIYTSHSLSNWDITTYVDGCEWEGYYNTFSTKAKALKEVTKIKHELFSDGVESVEVIVDYDGGLEQQSKTYFK